MLDAIAKSNLVRTAKSIIVLIPACQKMTFGELLGAMRCGDLQSGVRRPVVQNHDCVKQPLGISIELIQHAGYLCFTSVRGNENQNLWFGVCHFSAPAYAW